MEDDRIIWWAKATVGKPGGFIAYDDTPNDWSVINHIVKIEMYPQSEITVKAYDKEGGEVLVDSDVSDLRRLTFVHPSGYQCVVPICLGGAWSWVSEIDLVVRHGSNSEEHKRFLAGV